MPQNSRRDPRAPIEVISITSSGGPALLPRVDENEAHGLLCKAATKLNVAGDFLAVAEDLFGCGFPDVTVRFQRAGATASDIHAWTLLAPQPDRESQGHEAADAGHRPRSC